jgi:hypothetical protein
VRQRGIQYYSDFVAFFADFGRQYRGGMILDWGKGVMGVDLFAYTMHVAGEQVGAFALVLISSQPF